MDEVAFLGNHLVQDAVVRNLEIVGEASNNIGKHYAEFLAAHPELPLAFVYQMRNGSPAESTDSVPLEAESSRVQ